MKMTIQKKFAISLAVILLAACSRPQIQVIPTQTAIPTQNWDGGLIITLADNGKTIEMKVGESVLVKLGNELNWSISIADGSILSRVKNIMVINGAQGVYQALQAGTTLMSISGDPPCRASTPPCMMPSMLFQVTISVK